MSYREVLVRIPAADRERYLDAVGALCGSGIYVEDYTDMAETLRSVRYDYIDETLLEKDAGSVTVHFDPEAGSGNSCGTGDPGRDGTGGTAGRGLGRELEGAVSRSEVGTVSRPATLGKSR